MSENLPSFGPVDRLKRWRELYPPALWVSDNAARIFLLEKGVVPTPEVQFELSQITEEEKAKKPLDRKQLEIHISRLKEAFEQGEAQQRLIEETLPELSPEKKSFDDVVTSIDVFYSTGTSPELRVRATTERGFRVFVAKIPLPSKEQKEKKLADAKKKWGTLSGKRISFAPKKSPNGRNFLTITASSLPANLRTK
jgi:hypothetical protein